MSLLQEKEMALELAEETMLSLKNQIKELNKDLEFIASQIRLKESVKKDDRYFELWELESYKSENWEKLLEFYQKYHREENDG